LDKGLLLLLLRLHQRRHCGKNCKKEERQTTQIQRKGNSTRASSD